MEPAHNNIYREQQELRRLMTNFGRKPSNRTIAELDRMFDAQREKFIEIERERTRSRKLGRGR